MPSVCPKPGNSFTAKKGEGILNKKKNCGDAETLHTQGQDCVTIKQDIRNGKEIHCKGESKVHHF